MAQEMVKTPVEAPKCFSDVAEGLGDASRQCAYLHLFAPLTLCSFGTGVMRKM